MLWKRFQLFFNAESVLDEISPAGVEEPYMRTKFQRNLISLAYRINN